MKTGILLVDIQNDYFPKDRMELIGMREASSKAKDLLSLFRKNQWPIFHMQHIAARAAFDFGFSCIIVHDACATRDLVFEDKTIPADMVHGAFMSALGSLYAGC